MKNKKIILLIALLAVAIIGLGAVGLRAWLTSQETGTVTFTVGEVSYTLTTPTTGTTVVPGVDILGDTDITLTNGSNVDTKFRFYWYFKSAAGTVSGNNGGTALVASDITFTIDTTTNFTAATATISVPTNYTSGGSYYTYNNTLASTDTTAIPLISGIVLNGATVGNAKAGATLEVVIVFQAKQADGVDWADMGSIDFTTGLAA